jgi:hypothetical protein
MGRIVNGPGSGVERDGDAGRATAACAGMESAVMFSKRVRVRAGVRVTVVHVKRNA